MIELAEAEATEMDWASSVEALGAPSLVAQPAVPRQQAGDEEGTQLEPLIYNGSVWFDDLRLDIVRER